ncbi:MAG: hypothetical protein N3J91_14580 [Verrucomicrobiae bacterium]|nr:hypothetical protein [Verrucomicrobiae bacterium]
MNSDWAAQQLHTIRTLMERSALYRRALAPVTTLTGALGLAAGLLGWKLNLGEPIPFVLFWGGTALVAMVLVSLLIRRQAFKAAEPFWSPPMRRVAQAVALPAVAAVVLSVYWCLGQPAPESVYELLLLWLLLYGLALNAAGFFMRRGIRLFGGLMALLGLALGGYFLHAGPPAAGAGAHLWAGALFGGPHLAYGIYLYFTEKKTS